MKRTKILKLISAIGESILGFPIVGGLLIIGLAWTPLLIMGGLHIATLIVSAIDGKKFHGSILGIIASVLGVIPVVGMLLHIATAITLWIDFVKEK